MTHSLRPVCNSLFYEDVGQSRTDHEIHFFFFFNLSFVKEKMWLKGREWGDPGGREEEWGRRESGRWWRGEHMWKTLQRGSRRSRCSWCVLLGGAAVAKG